MSLKVKLHPKQLEVVQSEARFKVINAGRRWGKSVLSRMILLSWATKKPGNYWLVSPTYKQSKQIHWRDYQNEIPAEWVEKKNEVDLSIKLKNGSYIELKGAENPDALRGVKLSGLVVDEISSIRDWNWLWQEVLRATLTDNVAPAIFISTPQGYNHFHELYQRGQGEDPAYKSWRFTTYDNPFIPVEEIEAAKRELTEDAFAQEYMADFRVHTGLVYKEFDRMKHVVPSDTEYEATYYIMGHDVGFTNPRAIPIVAVDRDDNWLQVDEIYEPGLTNTEATALIKTKITGKNIELATMDSAHASDIQEMNDNGLNFIPVRKESGEKELSWVSYKVRKLRQRIIEGKYKVMEHCENTISEFESYRYPDRKQDQSEPEVPLKLNDHMMDALGDLNAMYLHYYVAPKITPGYGKAPGTFVPASPTHIEHDDDDEGAPFDTAQQDDISLLFE